MEACYGQHSGTSFLRGGWRHYLSSYVSYHKIEGVTFEDRGDAGALATFSVRDMTVRFEVCIDGALPWRAYHLVPSTSDRAMSGDMTALPPYAASKQLAEQAVYGWRGLCRVGAEQQGVEAIEQIIAATLDMFGIPDSEVEV